MSMQSGGRRIVLVGGGLASLSAAETLRREGYEGQITLLSAEEELPYDRPPLSKDLLAGTIPEEKVILRTEDFYVEQGIDLRPRTRVVELDGAGHTLKLADGSHVAYDQVLLATGCVPRLLMVPGADLPGVMYLRTLGDARALIQALAWAKREDAPVALVGAGFIGSEVAAICREHGLTVTVIEPMAAPMVRALGEEVGRVFAELQRMHGVDLRLGEGVRELRGSGHVEEVATASGNTFPCGLLIVAIGVIPAIDWLSSAGAAIRDGVVVDERCQTSLSDVFAAGDVAEWPYVPAAGRSFAVRLEHWDNALRQGEAAAQAMLGHNVLYRPVPYFWSDQYDWRVQMAGLAVDWDRVVLRGRPHDGAFVACYLGGGRLCAALAVNRVREFLSLKKLVAVGAALTPEELADESVDLRTLAAR
jgi:3-phenylpropionate/trans-cinnamate dioxygenase ferredoxin reductase subunit